MGNLQNKIMLMIGCSFIGLIFAMVENYFYVNNILLNGMITGDITMYALEIFTVFIWLLIGVVLSAN